MRHSPRGYKRTDRIADQIQRELAVLLQREISDPRVGMVTVSGVKVARDLSFADVYVSFMTLEKAEEVKQALAVLEHASGFLRSMLAKNIKLRVIPRLRFHFDQVIVTGPHISSLITKAIREDESRQNGQSSHDDHLGSKEELRDE
ncbi:Ribosome-binding factor A [gamma proteobacterium HdN1]|nr:Ribosome-binding factor A [gamma proteobacterium HdN1]